MGGLIMPPVMAVAGFIMAEFLGVPYWNVMIRGFALAFIYYSTLALSIYLMSVRLMPPDPIEKVTMPVYEQIKTGIFFLGIIFLTILIGLLGLGEQLAGLYTGAFILRGQACDIGISDIVRLNSTILRSNSPFFRDRLSKCLAAELNVEISPQTRLRNSVSVNFPDSRTSAKAVNSGPISFGSRF